MLGEQEAVYHDQFINLVRTQSDPNASQKLKEIAQKWIVEFVRDKHFWPVCIKTINEMDCRNDVIFAISVVALLKAKIKSFWLELVDENKREIKSFLLNLLVSLADCVDTPVMNTFTVQLSLCIVYIAIYEVPDVWSDFFEVVFKFFGTTLTGFDTTDYALKLIQYFFEELSGKNISTKKKNKIRGYLYTVEDKLLESLHFCVQSDQTNEIQKQRAIRCIGNYGFPIDKMVKNNTLGMIFELLKNDELMQEAAFAIMAMMDSTEMSEASDDIIHDFINEILSIIDYHVNHTPDGEDKSLLLCNMMVECTRIFEQYLTLDKNIFVSILQIIIYFTESNDEDLMLICLTFWKMFFINFNEKYDHEIKDISFPYIEKIVKCFRDQCLIPEEGWNNPSQWQTVAKEFYKHRYLFFELVDEYMVDLADVIIEICYPDLARATYSGDFESARIVEGTLYFINSCHRALSPENEYAMKLFELVPIFYDDSRVRKVAVLVVGDFSKFIKTMPDIIPTSLQYILDTFSDDTSRSNAAIAFKDFCGHCGNLILPYFNDIYTFIMDYLGKLEGGPRQWALSGIATLIYQMPSDEAIPAMQRLVIPIFEDLDLNISLSHRPETRTDISDDLRVLYGLVNSTAPFNFLNNNPYVAVYNDILERVQQLLIIYQFDNEMIAYICKFVRVSITHMKGIFYLPFVEKTFEMTLQNYMDHPHEDYLHVMNMLYRAYPQNFFQSKEEIRPYIEQILHISLDRLSESTFIMISKDLYSRPDVIQVYYTILTTIMKSNPNILKLIGKKSLSRIISRTIEILPHLTMRKTFSTAQSFLMTFLIFDGNNLEFYDVIRDQYGSLIKTQFDCIEQGSIHWMKLVEGLFKILHKYHSSNIQKQLALYLFSPLCSVSLSELSKTEFIRIFQSSEWDEDFFEDFYREVKGI